MRVILSTFLLLFFLGSCSSTQVSDESLSVDEDSFKREKPIDYERSKDEFKNTASRSIDLLGKESLYRSLRLDQGTELNHPVSSVLKSCFEGAFPSDEIRELVGKYRKDPYFWTMVGTCYMRKGEYQKALLYYNKSMEFVAHYAPALNNIGVLYLLEGNASKGEVAFSRAVKLNESARTPRLNLAKLYTYHGIFKSAREHLFSLQKLSPNDTEVNALLGMNYFLDGDMQRAKQFFDRADKDMLARLEVGLGYVHFLIMANLKEQARDFMSNLRSFEGQASEYQGKLKELL